MANWGHALMRALDTIDGLPGRRAIPALDFDCDTWCGGSPTCSCPVLWQAIEHAAKFSDVEPWATKHDLYWGKSKLWWTMRAHSIREWHKEKARWAALNKAVAETQERQRQRRAAQDVVEY